MLLSYEAAAWISKVLQKQIHIYILFILFQLLLCLVPCTPHASWPMKPINGGKLPQSFLTLANLNPMSGGDLPKQSYNLGIIIILLLFFFFWDLLKEVESSLRTNWDCLASLKCRTPCRNRHDYRLNHPHGRQDRPKTTRVKAKSL